MYDLTLLVVAIRRRWRFVLVLFVLIVALGTLAIWLSPRTYSTTSLVLVKRPNTNPQTTTYPEIDALLAWNPETTIETYVALARQPAIAQRVIHDLGLHVSVDDMLGRYIVVTPLTNSDIIQYQADWPDRGNSAKIANAFARAFVEQQRALTASQASAAAASLSIAFAKARSDLSTADSKLNEFESRYALADGPTQTTAILSAIGDIQTKQRVAEADRAQGEAQLASVVSQLKIVEPMLDSSKTIGVSPEADQIEQQLALQQLRLNLLRRQFTDKYPDVVDVKRQIASLEAELRRNPKTKIMSTTIAANPIIQQLNTQASTLQAQVAGDTAQLKQLRSQEASLYSQLRGFPSRLSMLSNLQRQVKSDEAIYDALQTSYFNALVAKSMAVSDLSVVQWADPALANVRPRRSTSLAVLVVIGLLLTITLVGLLDWLESNRTSARATS